MKKRMPIEDLLVWTYRDELPKQVTSALTGWEKMIYLGTTIDEAPMHPKLPAVLGPPHPDALRIEWRVRKLQEEVAVNWSWVRKELMPDLAAYIEGDDYVVHTVARMVTRRRATIDQYLATAVACRASPRALVEMHARLGNAPAWDLGPVALKRVQAEGNGKAKVLGPEGSSVARDPGGRLLPGAYCPLVLDPAAEDIAEARFEHIVWHVALVQLAADCKSDLEDHEALPPRPVQRPWVTWGARPAPRQDTPLGTSQRPSLAICGAGP